MQGRAADVRHSQSDVYRELFESALVGLYSARADGTLLQCNDAFLRIFGFGSRAEALAAPLDRLHVSADRRDGFLHRLRQSGRIERARIPMRRCDGRIVHLLSSAVGVRDDSGELAEFRGVVIDVTASAQAEDALRASEQHSRAVFDDAADPILILDDERHIVDANNAAVALLGAEASLIGEQLDALVTGDRSSLEAAWRELLAFGEARREHHVTTSGRGPRILECSYRASIYEGRHLCIARDVTERRRIEERLMQSEKIESVGRLAGGIAHDFNNLLTAILGYTELLIDTQQFEGTARSDLEEILKAGRRAASLTQKLLAYGRKQLLLPQKVDLNRVVTELREMLSRLIREDIDLTLDLAEEPAPVQIDTAQLDQVIMNLVLNARDALPGGGAIRLEVARVQLTAAEIPVDQPAHGINYVRLRVSDNGVGMSDEVRAHLFEPFFTTKDVGKGTGLGLASVYGIVRQSHGFIAVESEPGRGSTITMHFPAAEAPAEGEGTALPSTLGVRGRETVLVVEDEDAVRLIVATTLVRHGYRVIEAASPQSACDIFAVRSREIDLLLSDVVMPGMNGPTLAQHLVAVRPGLRVLFMSGHARPSMAVDLDRQIRFLAKPFQPSDLVAAVRDVLSRHSDVPPRIPA